MTAELHSVARSFFIFLYWFDESLCLQCENGIFVCTPFPYFQRYRRSRFAISSSEFLPPCIFNQSMTSAAFRWSGRSLSSSMKILGQYRRNHETSIRSLFPQKRSFFTALDSNSFDQANLDPLPITSKFSERNSHVQDISAVSKRDGTHALDTAVYKSCSAVSISTDLAELLGCEPHQIPSHHTQGYLTRRPEQNSTIRATPLSVRDGLAHNVIFE